MASDDDSSFRVYPAVICLRHLSDRYNKPTIRKATPAELSISDKPRSFPRRQWVTCRVAKPLIRKVPPGECLGRSDHWYHHVFEHREKILPAWIQRRVPRRGMPTGYLVGPTFVCLDLIPFNWRWPMEGRNTRTHFHLFKTTCTLLSSDRLNGAFVFMQLCYSCSLESFYLACWMLLGHQSLGLELLLLI